MDNNNDWRQPLGITLALVGISCMGLIKVLIGRDWSWLSILISIVSVLLLMDSRLILNGRFFRFPKSIGFIFCFYLLTLLYCLFSDWNPMANHGIVYELFYFAQILLLWNVRDLNEEKLVNQLFFVTLIANILGFYLILRNASYTNSLVFSILGESTTRTTTGNLATCLVIACLCFIPSSNKLRLLRVIGFVFATINIMLSNRRTEIVSVLLFIGLYWLETRKERVSKRDLIVRAIAICAVIIGGLTLYSSNTVVRNAIDRSVLLLINGIYTYLGKENVDLSASYRRNVIETLPHEYFFNTAPLQFFFGHGYMKGWHDMPYIQVFWDMGLLGGILYIVIQFFIPLKYILVRKYTPALFMAKCFALRQLVFNISSGTPYGICFGLVLLVLLYTRGADEEAESV